MSHTLLRVCFPLAALALWAQQEIPLPEVPTRFAALPGVDKLPAQAGLPDILTMNDGTRVTTVRQWERRREEMKRILAYYAVGHAPPAPGNVTGAVIKRESVMDGKVNYRLVRLTFGPRRALTLDIGIFTPAREGRFPAIILMSGTPPGAGNLPRLQRGPNEGRGENVLLHVGPEPPAMREVPPPPDAQKLAAERAMVFERGFALVVFNPNDCAEDTTLRKNDGSWAFRHTRFYPAYPGYDWGILAGWAWGASRIADYLEHDPAIDMRTVVVTGASRYGKASMVAAAFDERLSGAPVVTGGGGVGAYRLAGPDKSETLDIMQKKYPNWFSPHLRQFSGQREKLPFDQHWFLALAAPRKFLALEGVDDHISLPAAVKASLAAAQPAYDLYGKRANIAVHYSNHGHAFTNEDWTALLEFFAER